MKLFQYFSDTFDHLIAADKREGKCDMGIWVALWGCLPLGQAPDHRSPLTHSPSADLALALMRSTRRASRPGAWAPAQDGQVVLQGEQLCPRPGPARSLPLPTLFTAPPNT